MLRTSLLYLIYKPYSHTDRTAFIENSFACKCLFPQTGWLSLSVILCTLLLKPISFAFRQNKQTPLPFKALLDLRLAFKSKIFDLPRLITTWKSRSALSFPPFLFTFWLLVLLLMLRWSTNENSGWNGLSQRSPLPVPLDKATRTLGTKLKSCFRQTD